MTIDSRRTTFILSWQSFHFNSPSTLFFFCSSPSNNVFSIKWQWNRVNCCIWYHINSDNGSWESVIIDRFTSLHTRVNQIARVWDYIALVCWRQYTASSLSFSARPLILSLTPDMQYIHSPDSSSTITRLQSPRTYSYSLCLTPLEMQVLMSISCISHLACRKKKQTQSTLARRHVSWQIIDTRQHINWTTFTWSWWACRWNFYSYTCNPLESTATCPLNLVSNEAFVATWSLTTWRK